MPKEMFNKISKDKQEIFLNAAIDEFTTKSFENTSVNSIVKKAGISRGSFYNYFNDIEELFNFIFTKVKNDRFIYANEILKECNKDYFVFIKELFAHDYDSFKSKGRYSLFRNFIHYTVVSKKGSIRNVIINPLSSEFMDNKKSFQNIFDFKKYGMNLEESLDLMEMVMIVVVNTFLKSESEELSKEEVLKIFNQRMNIIEYGTRKRDV